MIKKSLLILISLFVFMSCSKPVTSPNNNSEVLPPLTEEELIAKYGIDISQDNAVIKQQIVEKLRAYFQEKGSYRIILTGTPKVGGYTFYNNGTLSAIIEDSAEELYLKNTTIDIDIRNVNFINGAIPREIFSIFSTYRLPIFNYIFPKDKITTIEAMAFYENPHIRELEIPDSVTSVENMAFSGCPNLTTIIYYGDSPNKIKCGNHILSNSPNLKTLIIPNAANEKDEAWKTFLGGNFTDIRRQ